MRGSVGGLLAVVGAMCLAGLLAFAGPAQARDSFAFADTYDFGGEFGADGPTSLAVHDATDTLYAIDSSKDRIVKFDITDPLNPVPADFSALDTNEITQADGTALTLITASNIAVDNSGGPQDGAIYLATSSTAFPPAGTQEAHAFSASGEWLYQVRINGDGEFDPNGVNSLTALAVAVAKSGPRAGEIAVIGNNFGGDTAVFAPGATPGDFPTLSARGTSGGILQTSGTHTAGFSSDGGVFRFIRTNFAGTGLQGGEAITTDGLVYGGRFAFGDSGSTSYTNVGFSSDGDRLYVRSTASGGRIDVFRQTGFLNFLTGVTGTELVGQFGFGDQGSGRGMAETEGGYLYLGDSAGELRIFEPATAPDATMVEPESLGTTQAKLTGTVNAQGLTITQCEFRWGTTPAYTNTPEPCDITPSGSGDVTVTADIPVTPRTIYHAALSVAADNGTVTTTRDLEWQAPDLPVAETLPVGPQERSGTAVLGGTVDPNETPVGYYIEYSTDSNLDDSLRYPTSENVSVPVGDSPVRMNQRVPGLANDTTYYFRVVAETAAGSDTGSIESFTTFAEPSQPQPTVCDNAAFRTGSSASLPDCRAWEQVSPQDKQGGQVAHGGTVPTVDGDRVAYVASSAFAGARSLGLITNYVSNRDGEGWTSRPTAPPTSIPISQIAYNILIETYTPNLSRGVGRATNVGLPGAPPSNTSAFLWDSATDMNYSVAIGGPDVSGRNVTSVTIAEDGSGGTVDGQRLPVDRGPEVPTGQPAVYWWTDTAQGRELELASTLPNGDPAITPAQNGVGGGALSSDGNKTLWIGRDVPGRPGSSEVYLARRGQPTLWVSEAQGIPQPAEINTVIEAWTPDLRYVFFSSRTQLTDDATAQLGSEDLYRYDTENGQLEDLTTADPDGGGVQAVFNLSDDGESIYFTATGNLAPGASGSVSKLYGMRNGSIRLISDFPYDINSGSESGGFARGAPVSQEYRRGARVSADGRYLLFPFGGSTAGTRMDSVYETNGHLMYYRYDWQQDRIDCVSCSPSGDPATSDANLHMPREFRTSDLGTFGGIGRERRFMTDSGEVIFNTRQGLVPADGNDRNDAYIWDGDLRLLTDGSSDYHQWAEAASDGFQSVYVLSSKQLVPADADGATDLYVARVGGGLASQQVRPSGPGKGCQGESCQGLGLESPTLPRLDSRSSENRPAASVNECARQRSASTRTARAVRRARSRFRTARRTTKSSIQRYRRQSSAVNRKNAVKRKRQLKRNRAQLKRYTTAHRRSRAALRRCQGGGS